MSPVETPSTPCSIVAADDALHVGSSSAVGFRSSSPMTSSRTVPRPTYDSRFTEMPLLLEHGEVAGEVGPRLRRLAARPAARSSPTRR